MNKVNGIVHITSFKREEDHKNAIEGFLSTSVLQEKSNSIMARYGLNEVYTLSYDSIAERLSLTLCVGDGEIIFRTFSISDYRTETNHSQLGMIQILEEILEEIEKVGVKK